MSLIYRIKRLVKSDLHALVEGMEDQKWILAQAIRDMEEELEKIQTGISAKIKHTQKLKDQIHFAEKSLATFEADIEFAIKEKREEIAKGLIRKQIVTRQNKEKFFEEERRCQKELENLESEYLAKKRLYDEICARSEAFNLDRMDDDIFSSASRLVPQETGLDHQVELEFLRRLQKAKEVVCEN